MLTQQHDKIKGFDQFLIRQGWIDKNNLVKTTHEVNKKNSLYLTYLKETYHLSYCDLATATATYFNLPQYDLNHYDIKKLHLDLFNPQLIKRYFALPLFLKNNELVLGVSDPSTIDTNEISFITGTSCSLVILEFDKLEVAIHSIYNQALEANFIIDENEKIQRYSGKDDICLNDSNLLETHSITAPVIQLLNQTLHRAIQKKASDIHFEPHENYLRIRYRIDGLLHEINRFPVELAKYITTRLKILANLDIAEHRLPQDGRFNLVTDKDKNMDVRLNICPTLYGEKCVLRLLQSSRELLSLRHLGLEPSQLELFLHAIQQPQGMILVTGPTGSGKTMTLYSILAQLNTSQVNIVSIEDPIEIPLAGINQVQVNLKSKMTFEKGLRAFLRQDPDIIMIGEMRDHKTAKIGVSAAQTGHLVLSTLHTNNTVETLTRLLNLGIAPYNVINSIILLMAQRLIRKLCDHCKKPHPMSQQQLMQAGFDPTETYSVTLYEPQSCTKCHQGYYGRLGIFELLTLSEEMHALILRKEGIATLYQQMHKENIVTLRQSALNKVKQGITSLSEINRVVGNW